MRDQTHPEDALKDKEIKGSVGDNLKCFFEPFSLLMKGFFMNKNALFFVIFLDQS